MAPLCRLVSFALAIFAHAAAGQLFDDVRLTPDRDHAPFLHGVASADPLPDAVLLWTRATPDLVGATADVPLQWAVWLPESGSFAAPTVSGTLNASGANDWTVTVDAQGLASGTRYAYQFEVVATGARSALGSTKTASTTATTVKMAFLSCTSQWSGYFNVYQRIAQDTELDFWMNLGDYLYVDMDPQEIRRAPVGLCQDKLFEGYDATLTDLGPSSNEDPHLAEMAASFPCNKSLVLERFRWFNALVLLDPDLRAARAAHPSVVTLDNHDLHNRRNRLNASRRAALEWIPQRHVLRPRVNANNNTVPPAVDTLRRLRFGDGLVDLFLLDTYTTETGSAAEDKLPRPGGLLVEDQLAWLDSELGNSTRDGVQWRVFGQTKMLMPITLNRIHKGMHLYFGLFFGACMLALLCCVGGSVARHRRALRIASAGKTFDDSSETSTAPPPLAAERVQSQSQLGVHRRSSAALHGAEDPEALAASARRSLSCGSPADDDHDTSPTRTRAARAREGLRSAGFRAKTLGARGVAAARSSRREVLASYRSGPRAVRWCLVLGVLGVFFSSGLWLASIVTLRTFFDRSRIMYLQKGPDTWEAYPASRQAFFDALKRHAATSNNLVASGDMHMHVANDLVEFDELNTDLLEYDYADPVGYTTFGGEMLPSSGTRGNLDEKVLELTGAPPGSFLNNLLSDAADHVITTANRHFRFFNSQDHGYGRVTFSRTELRAEFVRVDILERTDREEVLRSFYMRDGDSAWRDPEDDP